MHPPDPGRRSLLLGRLSRIPDKAARIAVDDRCLTHRGVECRICGDACEPRALRFPPAPGGIAQLRIETDACTGCGDCVTTCPVGALTLRRPG